VKQGEDFSQSTWMQDWWETKGAANRARYLSTRQPETSRARSRVPATQWQKYQLSQAAKLDAEFNRRNAMIGVDHPIVKRLVDQAREAGVQLQPGDVANLARVGELERATNTLMDRALNQDRRGINNIMLTMRDRDPVMAGLLGASFEDRATEWAKQGAQDPALIEKAISWLGTSEYSPVADLLEGAEWWYTNLRHVGAAAGYYKEGQGFGGELSGLLAPLRVVQNWDATKRGSMDERRIDELRTQYPPVVVDAAVSITQAVAEGDDAVFARMLNDPATPPEVVTFIRDILYNGTEASSFGPGKDAGKLVEMIEGARIDNLGDIASTGIAATAKELTGSDYMYSSAWRGAMSQVGNVAWEIGADPINYVGIPYRAVTGARYAIEKLAPSALSGELARESLAKALASRTVAGIETNRARRYFEGILYQLDQIDTLAPGSQKASSAWQRLIRQHKEIPTDVLLQMSKPGMIHKVNGKRTIDGAIIETADGSARRADGFIDYLNNQNESYKAIVGQASRKAELAGESYLIEQAVKAKLIDELEPDDLVRLAAGKRPQADLSTEDILRIARERLPEEDIARSGEIVDAVLRKEGATDKPLGMRVGMSARREMTMPYTGILGDLRRRAVNGIIAERIGGTRTAKIIDEFIGEDLSPENVARALDAGEDAGKIARADRALTGLGAGQALSDRVSGMLSSMPNGRFINIKTGENSREVYQFARMFYTRKTAEFIADKFLRGDEGTRRLILAGLIRSAAASRGIELKTEEVWARIGDTATGSRRDEMFAIPVPGTPSGDMMRATLDQAMTAGALAKKQAKLVKRLDADAERLRQQIDGAVDAGDEAAVRSLRKKLSRTEAKAAKQRARQQGLLDETDRYKRRLMTALGMAQESKPSALQMRIPAAMAEDIERALAEHADEGVVVPPAVVDIETVAADWRGLNELRNADVASDAGAAATAAPRLPESLRGGKPKYKDKNVTFSDDIDRALYIVRDSAKRSKRDEEYMEWLREQFTGLDDAAIRAKGEAVRARIKALYDESGDTVAVSGSTAPPAASRPGAQQALVEDAAVPVVDPLVERASMIIRASDDLDALEEANPELYAYRTEWLQEQFPDLDEAGVFEPIYADRVPFVHWNRMSPEDEARVARAYMDEFMPDRAPGTGAQQVIANDGTLVDEASAVTVEQLRAVSSYGPDYNRSVAEDMATYDRFVREGREDEAQFFIARARQGYVRSTQQRASRATAPAVPAQQADQMAFDAQGLTPPPVRTPGGTMQEMPFDTAASAYVPPAGTKRTDLPFELPKKGKRFGVDVTYVDVKTPSGATARVYVEVKGTDRVHQVGAEIARKGKRLGSTGAPDAEMGWTREGIRFMSGASTADMELDGLLGKELKDAVTKVRDEYDLPIYLDWLNEGPPGLPARATMKEAKDFQRALIRGPQEANPWDLVGREIADGVVLRGFEEGTNYKAILEIDDELATADEAWAAFDTAMNDLRNGVSVIDDFAVAPGAAAEKSVIERSKEIRDSLVGRELYDGVVLRGYDENGMPLLDVDRRFAGDDAMYYLDDALRAIRNGSAKAEDFPIALDPPAIDRATESLQGFPTADKYFEDHPRFSEWEALLPGSGDLDVLKAMDDIQSDVNAEWAKMLLADKDIEAEYLKSQTLLLNPYDGSVPKEWAEKFGKDYDDQVDNEQMATRVGAGSGFERPDWESYLGPMFHRHGVISRGTLVDLLTDPAMWEEEVWAWWHTGNPGVFNDPAFIAKYGSSRPLLPENPKIKLPAARKAARVPGEYTLEQVTINGTKYLKVPSAKAKSERADYIMRRFLDEQAMALDAAGQGSDILGLQRLADAVLSERKAAALKRVMDEEAAEDAAAFRGMDEESLPPLPGSVDFDTVPVAAGTLAAATAAKGMDSRIAKAIRRWKANPNSTVPVYIRDDGVAFVHYPPNGFPFKTRAGDYRATDLVPVDSADLKQGFQVVPQGSSQVEDMMARAIDLYPGGWYDRRFIDALRKVGYSDDQIKALHTEVFDAKEYRKARVEYSGTPPIKGALPAKVQEALQSMFRQKPAIAEAPAPSTATTAAGDVIEGTVLSRTDTPIPAAEVAPSAPPAPPGKPPGAPPAPPGNPPDPRGLAGAGEPEPRPRLPKTSELAQRLKDYVGGSDMPTMDIDGAVFSTPSRDEFGREHALHMYQTSDYVVIPHLSEIEAFGRIQSNAPWLGRTMQSTTDIWSLATLYGVRFAMRSSVEDLLTFALTGGLGHLSDLQRGRRGSTALRESNPDVIVETAKDGTQRIITPKTDQWWAFARSRPRTSRLGMVARTVRALGDKRAVAATSKFVTDLTQRGNVESTQSFILGNLPQESVIRAAAELQAGRYEAMQSLIAEAVGRMHFTDMTPRDIRSLQLMGGTHAGRMILEKMAEAGAQINSGTYKAIDDAIRAVADNPDLTAVGFSRPVQFGAFKKLALSANKVADPHADWFWHRTLQAIVRDDGPIGQVFVKLMHDPAMAKKAIADAIRKDTKYGYRERFSLINSDIAVDDFANRYYESSLPYFQKADGTINERLRSTFIDTVIGKDGKAQMRVNWYQEDKQGRQFMRVTSQTLGRSPRADKPLYVLGREEKVVTARNENGLKDRAWEWMGNQYARIAREPIFIGNYMANMRALQPFEDNLAKAIAAGRPGKAGTKVTEADRKAAEAITARHAQDSAYAFTLNYMDNPANRSVLAWKVRNVARYYRATEDFARRAGRLAKNYPDAYYKLALTYQVLEDTGFTYRDDNGDMYFAYPANGMLQDAMSAFGSLTNGGFGTPVSADPFMVGGFVKNLAPSTDPEQWAPTFTGIVTIPLTGFFNMFPSLQGLRAATLGGYSSAGQTGNFVGEIVDGILPAGVKRIWSQMEPAERESTLASSGTAAVASMIADGLFDKVFNVDNPLTLEQLKKNDVYAEAQRRAVGLTLSKVVMGYTVPAAPQVFQNNVTLFARESGIESIDSLWHDLIEENDGDIAEAYLDWQRMDPDGKLLPFTVSKTKNDPDRLMGLTGAKPYKEVVDWMRAPGTKEIAARFPDSYMFLAPQNGTFDWAAWAVVKSAGFRVDKTENEMLIDLFAASGEAKDRQVVNAYDLEIAKYDQTNDEQRKIVRELEASRTADREAIKNQNPYWATKSQTRLEPYDVESVRQQFIQTNDMLNFMAEQGALTGTAAGIQSAIDAFMEINSAKSLISGYTDAGKEQRAQLDAELAEVFNSIASSDAAAANFIETILSSQSLFGRLT
jgi:hypothetical protein